jgi:hypothetical protein
MRYSKDGKKEFLVRTKIEGGKSTIYSFLPFENTDFKDEKPNLEHLATELFGRGTIILILFTPKYHCKLASEGIEYCRGKSK